MENKPDFRITKVLTGHLNAGSPYETSDSCGNCDGALCHRCHEVYEVEELDGLDLLQFGWRRVDTLKEAEELVDELMKKAVG